MKTIGQDLSIKPIQVYFEYNSTFKLSSKILKKIKKAVESNETIDSVSAQFKISYQVAFDAMRAIRQSEGLL